jgi:hypothetical protein
MARALSSAPRQNATASRNDRPPSASVISRLSASKPPEAAWMRAKLRISRPKPTSSTSESASSATISSRRVRRPRSPQGRARIAQVREQVDPGR